MALASGLGASLGLATESTYGTAVGPTSWIEFNSESLELSKTVLQGAGLRGGGLYARASRRVVTNRNASGSVEMDVATNGMGQLFRQMLGTSTSTLVSGTAYRHVHTPGGLVGKSITLQKLVPDNAGTLVAFTYPGCKITEWELSCDTGAIATLSVTVDGKDEVTNVAAGTPSYSAGTGIFHFAQGAVILGGTVSTSAGLTTVTGGTTAASVRSATVSGTNPMTTGDDNLRYGGKREPSENGWRETTGTLEVDFVSRAAVYDAFSADTPTALVLRFTGTTAISGANFPTLEIVLPSIRFDGETPKVDGPDLIATSAGFTALDDGTNPAIQISQITSDATIL